MDLEGGVRVFKEVINGLQALLDAKGSLEKAQADRQISALLSQVADLERQHRQVVAENEDLRRKLNVKVSMRYEAPAYYRTDTGDGPFCQKCFDDEGKEVRLQVRDRDEFMRCTVCSKIFKKGSEVRQEVTSIRPFL